MYRHCLVQIAQELLWIRYDLRLAPSCYAVQSLHVYSSLGQPDWIEELSQIA